MLIKSLFLDNYRCFKKFDISFDDRLTVLVGENGEGKTSILDALSVFLVRAAHPVDKRILNYSIPLGDVAIGAKAKDVTYRIAITPRSGTNDSISFDFQNHGEMYNKINLRIKDFSEKAEHILGSEEFISCAYMSGRIVQEKDTILKESFNNPSAYAANENNFNRTIDYKSTLSWFDKMDADEARSMRDSGTNIELPELAAVREALSKALLGQYERPRMLGNPPELIVYKKGTNVAYKLSQLSDGYRAMLALVMDLARRMAQFNNAGNSPEKSLLHTPAIVLIDEIELHLHPSWQQTVLTTLMDIFPNTQFIVTTHSPQVLSAIHSKHIRVLSGGEAYTYDEQTEGAEASRLLKRVFGVQLRPAGLEIVKALNEYTNMVYAESWDSPEAKKLHERLIEHFGDDDPILMELELHIENAKWEKGL